jgi:hypothetical protein
VKPAFLLPGIELNVRHAVLIGVSSQFCLEMPMDTALRVYLKKNKPSGSTSGRLSELKRGYVSLFFDPDGL